MTKTHNTRPKTSIKTKNLTYRINTINGKCHDAHTGRQNPIAVVYLRAIQNCNQPGKGQIKQSSPKTRNKMKTDLKQNENRLETEWKPPWDKTKTDLRQNENW